MREVLRSRLCRESPLTPWQSADTLGSWWGWPLHPHRLPHGECGVWGSAPGPFVAPNTEASMTINHQPKPAPDAANSLLDAVPSALPAHRSGTDSEVVPHARRRQFSKADKRRILEAADLCTKPGDIGALMRREGVYSSSLST